jgi:hypothetical protein
VAATFPSLTLRCWSSAAIVCCAVLAFGSAKVDAADDTTAAARGSADQAKSERRNAVRCYHSKSGRLLDRFAALDALQLYDLAVAIDLLRSDR